MDSLTDIKLFLKIVFILSIFKGGGFGLLHADSDELVDHLDLKMDTLRVEGSVK